jgi:hypothetical protein
MNLSTLYRLQSDLEQHFPSLGAWQVKGLVLAVVGLLLQQQCGLSKIAEALPEVGGFNKVKQRLKRWMSNERVEVLPACYEWMAWVWNRSEMARPLLLVDETKLGDRLGVMMVSLAYEGRAIPLVWRCYVANNAAEYPQQGQVLLIYGLLAHVLWTLPPTLRPLVQMDRGLAHSAAMLRALKRLDIDFLVRIKQTACFTSRRGHRQPLAQMVKPGESSFHQGSLFRRDHAVKGNLYLIWEVGQAEAWCLFTNTRGLGGHRYALRWWQEESFKDLKSGGWQWQDSRLRCPKRMERLILVMAIAYGWMLSLGAQLSHLPLSRQRRVANRDEWQRMSLFRLGLRWFIRLVRCTPDALRVTLAFAPPAARAFS